MKEGYREGRILVELLNKVNSQKGLLGLRSKYVHETGYWLKVEGYMSEGLRNMFEIFGGL